MSVIKKLSACINIARLIQAEKENDLDDVLEAHLVKYFEQFNELEFYLTQESIQDRLIYVDKLNQLSEFHHTILTIIENKHDHIAQELLLLHKNRLTAHSYAGF